MIIDTSVLLAILFDEPDGPALLRRIAEAPIRLMSSANAIEAWIVADRHANPAKGPALDAFLWLVNPLALRVGYADTRTRAAGHRYARPSRPSASRLSLGIDQFWYDRNNIQGLSLWAHTVW
jgi:ribonuclease VapC